MNKINKEHLAGKAIIYIRQSTPDQVKNNLESQRRQYSFKDQAKKLGWKEIEVIDEDQGHSGSGITRCGFDRLLNEVCHGKVGAVFSMEASRLARNGREWHTLLDFCGLVKALIIDEEGIYDPRLPNDRLLLGMKGTLSEMELSTFRQRSQAALRLKAERGELFTIVGIGYIRTEKDGIEKDPDQRIRNAIELVFKKFRELGSARQVWLWFQDEKLELPALAYSSEHRSVVWKTPGYTSVLEILTHPVYSGAYSHGRTETQVRIENGRKIVKKGCRKKMEDWSILIVDHHEGYISWEEYCNNRGIIEGNANMKGVLVRGSARSGEALLVGLLRCGHCGRKLQVHYSGKEGKVIRYRCKSELIASSKGGCIAFGGTHVEEAVSRELLRVLDSVGLEAAISACQQAECRLKEKREQMELALEQARYEVKRAWRQYDAVDPDNRLVATELERRWNDALEQEKALEKRLELLCEEDAGVMEEDRDNLMSLATDLPFIWNYPASSSELRKRILRTVLKEVVANVKDGKIRLVLHWEGGDHSEVEVDQRRSGQHRFVTEVETERLIEELSRMMSDSKLAALLNRLGKRTARGYSWTQGRVCAFRNDHSIPVYKEGERQLRGELTLDEAARFLQVSAMGVRRLIKRKILPAKQICVGAPWVILKKDLSLMGVKQALGKQPPSTGNEKQQALILQ